MKRTANMVTGLPRSLCDWHGDSGNEIARTMEDARRARVAELRMAPHHAADEARYEARLRRPTRKLRG